MKKITYILCLLAGAVLTASCSLDETANVKLVRLGAVTKEYVVAADGAVMNVPVYSNNPYTIDYEQNVGDPGWLTYAKLNGDENGYIRVECSFNDNFKRKALLILKSSVDTRRDTITIKQEGQQEAYITMDNMSMTVSHNAGTYSTNLKTNVSFKDMVVSYPDSTVLKWITGFKVIDAESEIREVQVTVTENTDPVKPRSGAIKMTFTDGWGDSVSLVMNVVQENANGEVGTKITFEDLRDNYPSGEAITDFPIIEGYIVSNKDGRNAGENEQFTTSSIDYSCDQKTLYVESTDKNRGIMIKMATMEDNIYSQFAKVEIDLNGLTPYLVESSGTSLTDDCPEYMYIENVKQSQVRQVSTGSKNDVNVEKSISELTDDDMFTYRTLKNLEVTVRKGAICPMNEGYTIACNSNRVSKYPLLLMDTDGNQIFLYTNTTCLYRNDGKPLPYGCGKMSGVIVHERFSRFEWKSGVEPEDISEDPTLGNIGRYQLRHQTREDVYENMPTLVEEGKGTKILCEYRYWNPDKINGVCKPSYGDQNGWFTHTYQTKYTGNRLLDYTEDSFNQHMKPGGNVAYLGPIGNSKNYLFGANYYNINGLGMKLDLSSGKDVVNSELLDLYDSVNGEWCGPDATSIYANKDSESAINYNNSANLRGKAQVPSECYNAWTAVNWWNNDTQRPYGWLLKFSTSSVTSANHIFLHFSAQNNTQTYYAPRYWKVEWSYTESQKEADDSQWNLVGTFTIPDVVVWANTLYSSNNAYKHISFELPRSIAGKPEVYVRIMPTSDACSSGVDYVDTVLGDHTGNSTIEYIAIRYN